MKVVSNLLRYGGISKSSDFASRNKDTYLSFILNCRSDYLVAYPQKEQRTKNIQDKTLKDETCFLICQNKLWNLYILLKANPFQV